MNKYLSKLATSLATLVGAVYLSSCTPTDPYKNTQNTDKPMQGSGYLVPIDNSLNYDSIKNSKDTLFFPSAIMVGSIDTTNLKKQREDFFKKLENIAKE